MTPNEVIYHIWTALYYWHYKNGHFISLIVGFLIINFRNMRPTKVSDIIMSVFIMPIIKSPQKSDSGLHQESFESYLSIVRLILSLAQIISAILELEQSCVYLTGKRKMITHKLKFLLLDDETYFKSNFSLPKCEKK